MLDLSKTQDKHTLLCTVVHWGAVVLSCVLFVQQNSEGDTKDDTSPRAQDNSASLPSHHILHGSGLLVKCTYLTHSTAAQRAASVYRHVSMLFFSKHRPFAPCGSSQPLPITLHTPCTFTAKAKNDLVDQTIVVAVLINNIKTRMKSAQTIFHASYSMSYCTLCLFSD